MKSSMVRRGKAAIVDVEHKHSISARRQRSGQGPTQNFDTMSALFFHRVLALLGWTKDLRARAEPSAPDVLAAPACPAEADADDDMDVSGDGSEEESQVDNEGPQRKAEFNAWMRRTEKKRL